LLLLTDNKKPDYEAPERSDATKLPPHKCLLALIRGEC